MLRAKELTLSHGNLRDARKYRQRRLATRKQHPELYDDDVRDDGHYLPRN